MLQQPSTDFSLLEESGVDRRQAAENRHRGRSDSISGPTIRERAALIIEEASEEALCFVVVLFVAMSFIAFVLGCVATDKSRDNSAALQVQGNAIAALEASGQAPSVDTGCTADLIWGVDPVEGTHAFFQVIGGHGAAMTWFDAMRDAESRCAGPRWTPLLFFTAPLSLSLSLTAAVASFRIRHQVLEGGSRLPRRYSICRGGCLCHGSYSEQQGL